MKKLALFLICSAMAILFYQCQSDEILETTLQSSQLSGDTILISDNITSDVTWSSDNVYILENLVSVEGGATLN
jgi:hypothetical protein